jgi:2-polyprenyl-3-methyl-5-hydroxy-6-metoxy-1,4-benzoquinol methylase
LGIGIGRRSSSSRQDRLVKNNIIILFPQTLPAKLVMNESEIVRSALERAEAHAEWLNELYTDESRAFYESAFDHIVRVFGSRPKSTVLDAGCGSGSHAIRLAVRGYPVLAMDASEHILERARVNVAARNLSHMITFEPGSVTSLPMQDESFDFVICWNVLMLVPEVGKAISELCRVVRPDGFLIISEDNMWSLEALLVRIAHRILDRPGLMKDKNFYRPKITAAGAEYLRHTDAGPLFGRVARISWLVNTVASHGFALRERIGGEFLESKLVPGNVLKRCARKFNLLWFEHVRLPHPSMGNVLIFRKKRTDAGKVHAGVRQTAPTAGL